MAASLRAHARIDEWYVDVVCIRARRDDGQLTYHVTDEYADIIVEGMGPTGRST
ncbi:MAG TPA: hypothetical protein VGL33_16655 [Streptosporangiaceae bacterium]|jgi:hypothetical protein